MVLKAKMILGFGFCLILAFSAAAIEQTPGPGFVPTEFGSSNTHNGDRIGLINDGSFENGICDDGSSDWTCTSSSACFWIIDPTGVWGFPAYDGVQVAWLGGYCGEPNQNSFCQDIFFDASYLDWWWMGHDAGDALGGSTMYVEIGGNLVFSYIFQSPGDHTYGTWNTASDWIVPPVGLDVSAYYGSTHELCFGWILPGDGTNDNMLIDYVTLNGAPAPTELTVNPDGSGDVPTIQDAIDAIAEGGTIYLGNGTFSGPGNFALDCCCKNFELRSLNLNPETCTIDCQGVPMPLTPLGRQQDFRPPTSSGRGDRVPPDNVAIYIDSGQTSATIIRGITFMRGVNPNDYGGAIRIVGSSPVIQDCVFLYNYSIAGGGAIVGIESSASILGCRFSWNSANWGGAIEFYGASSSPIIEDCLFLENYAAFDGGALNVYDGANVEINYCQFLHNESSLGGAISLYWGSFQSTMDVRYSTFSENIAISGGALWVDSFFRSWFNIISYSHGGGALNWGGASDHPEFACCDIFGNVEGDWTGVIAPQLGSDGNISEDPQYCGGLGTWIMTLQADSACLPSYNDCGQLIGALGEGCGAPVESTSWSRVKQLY
jgi:hypothetical protein